MTAQPVFHAERLALVKRSGENCKTTVNIVGVNAFGPAIAQLLFNGPSGKIQPDLIEIVAFFIGSGSPDKRLSGISQLAVLQFTLLQCNFGNFPVGNIVNNGIEECCIVKLNRP